MVYPLKLYSNCHAAPNPRSLPNRALAYTSRKTYSACPSISGPACNNEETPPYYDLPMVH